MNSINFLKNKTIILCVLFLFCLSFLFFYFNNMQKNNEILIQNQKNSEHLFHSINLIKISQTLIGLDKQRSFNVFSYEYERILQSYKFVQLGLYESGALEYALEVSDIVNQLESFNKKANSRNDYNYRKNNLRVIIFNGMDLNERTERAYLWKLLSSAIEAKNLLELGELYREFLNVLNMVSIDSDDAESKKIKSVSFGSLNAFSTIEKIISLNIVLNKNIEEIKLKTDNLSNKIVKKLSEKQQGIPSSSPRTFYVLLIFTITLLSVLLAVCSSYVIRQNRKILLSLSDSADLESVSSKNTILNEKGLLLYGKAIPHIVRENNASFILVDNNDLPLYFSRLFYEQNEASFLTLKGKPSMGCLNYSIQDEHCFLSIGALDSSGVVDSPNTRVTAEIETIKKLDGDHKLIFIKSETEEKNKQDERLDSFAIVSGAVAHDINNMISVIVSSLSILRDSKSFNVGDGSKVIDRALFSADKSISLIDRLLTFSRCKKLSPELVNVNELLEGLYEVICFATDEKIDVQLILSDRPLYIYIDAGQLEASIINLCINSSNAIQNGGKITITSLVNASDRVTIMVKDNGHGIPKNIQGRVFEPFFTGRKKGEGHGLGLSMVHGFVKQSGGLIFLESKVGSGTKVSISFSPKKI
ncbi:ATP-binding protein [Marinomonas colpomeniae]|uniref:histidine kinase n=1 Tax=Marinomonas colpomeniae TaxID=2774408 RepID=A0ABR8NUF5_9GAMM|nr:ATP-binding protein [Marinomonas colpomeniae]MBD5769528.1 hypothetical protein [Marinomonas colpomeniae]